MKRARGPLLRSFLLAPATLLGSFPTGETAALLVNGVMGSTIGLALIADRGRDLQGAVYMALWIGVSIALSAVVLTVGADRVGVPGVLVVYLSCVTFAAFRTVAPSLIVLVSSLHLGALLIQIPMGEAFGTWAMTWGVAVVAGLVVGELVAANHGRHASATTSSLA